MPRPEHQAHLAVRMFVAVWPDEVTLERLSLFDLGHAPGLRLVRRGQWHVTLRFFGDVDESLVPALVGALEGAAASMAPPVHCELGPKTAWFGRQRVLHIPVAGLDQAAEAVRAATLPFVPGSGDGEPPFTGHLTIARSNRRRPGASAPATLAGLRFVASFDVEYIELVASQLSTGGPRYTTLARVRL